MAAVMLTNPNTCGVFENDIRRIADAVMPRAAILLRRANFNAIVGRVGRAISASMPCISTAQDLLDPAWRRRAGIRGRWCSRKRSRPTRRCRASSRKTGFWAWRRRTETPSADEGLPRPDGHVRARARLHDEPRRGRAAPGLGRCGAERELPAAPAGGRLFGALRPFPGRPCTRRCSTTARCGTRALHARHRQGDDRRGAAPDDVYFPLVVHGAMLVEPTETETRASLDRFRRHHARPRRTRPQRRAADRGPFHAPRRRLDETQAARKPVLRWRPEGEGRN